MAVLDEENDAEVKKYVDRYEGMPALARPSLIEVRSGGEVACDREELVIESFMLPQFSDPQNVLSWPLLPFVT